MIPSNGIMKIMSDFSKKSDGVKYIIRESSRTRRITVSVRRDGSVRVTKPRRISLKQVESFVQASAPWIARMRERFAGLPKTSKVESSAKEYKKYKKAAGDFVARRLAHFNVHYNFSYNRIFIRNQKSRWGSCSHSRNLSFNYRILFLPPHLADYLVVHELCHVQEMNHSPQFWALVAQTIPDHRAYRAQLRAREVRLLVE